MRWAHQAGCHAHACVGMLFGYGPTQNRSAQSVTAFPAGSVHAGSLPFTACPDKIETESGAMDLSDTFVTASPALLLVDTAAKHSESSA